MFYRGHSWQSNELWSEEAHEVLQGICEFSFMQFAQRVSEGMKHPLDALPTRRRPVCQGLGRWNDLRRELLVCFLLEKVLSKLIKMSTAL